MWGIWTLDTGISPYTWFPIMLLKPLGQHSIQSTPAVRLELTTSCLTVKRSTHWAKPEYYKRARQLPFLAGSCPPTTFGVKKLNFCVRHGNRCILLAFATVLFWAFTLKTKHNPSRKKPSSLLRFGQVLDWLVLVRSILHRTSTPSLSTSSSLRCLTAYAKEISSWGGLRT